MLFLIFYIIIINLNIIINNYDNGKNEEIAKQIISEINNINVLSVSYEISTEKNPILKVKIYTSNNLSNSMIFKAFLISDDNLKIFPLNCFNDQINIISCSINNNIKQFFCKDYHLIYSGF